MTDIFVSFVIPVRNGKQTIKRTLDSILSQKTSLSYEIIVVDNASEDKTVELIKNYPVLQLHENRTGRSFARNKGLFQAKGEWVCFVDADVVLDENWLYFHEFFFQQNIFDVFTGKIFPKTTINNTFFKFREEYLSKLSRGTFNLTDVDEFNVPMINTAACAIRKSHLLSINGFDCNLITFEDSDLALRLWREGANFCVIEKAHADVYWDKGEFLSYLMRSFHMGKGSSQYHLKWNSPIIFRPPSFRNNYYSSYAFKFFNFLMELAFFLGSQHSNYNSFSFENISKNCKKNKLKKILIGEKIFLTFPNVRFLQNSKFLIFKNTHSLKTLKLEKDSQDIIEIIEKNEQIILTEKMGFFLKC